MIRLVQLHHPQQGRFVAVVEEPHLRVLENHASIYGLAAQCITSGRNIADSVAAPSQQATMLNYDEIYEGRSPWKLLPCFDHPSDPTRCFVTGTGLTHKASAENRQSMHAATEQLTDSMKMYRIGLEGGSPPPGQIGAAPEWFYKGTGRILRAHGQSLTVPNHGRGGGEEAEIAGVYIIDSSGQPYRIGLAQGNEFSDHVMEAQNYLYLSASKLRQCALGPELVVGHDFAGLQGRAAVERHRKVIWQFPIASGGRWMSHSLANLEHHHFKHESHRHPGEAHIHFFGADVFSFRDRLKLQEADEMVVAFEGMGRPLRNPLHIDDATPQLVSVKVL
jgi:hypothetical protein